MKQALIYRDQIIKGSETFIPAQAENLNSYQPYYAGMRRVRDGLSIPENRLVVVNRGGAWGRLKEAIAQFVYFPSGYYDTIKKWEPCLVHAHFGPDSVNALRISRRLEIPLLVTYHGYDVTVKDEYAKKSFYRHRAYLGYRDEIKKEADGFIAVSDFIKDRLKNSGFPQGKIYQHYIGINTEKFNPSGSVDRENVIIFVGRLVEKKGGEYLIRAAAKVQETHPDTEVVFIGSGPRRDDLEKLARDVGCDVRFLGRQPPEQVRHWMNRARVFCVPSVTAESGDMEAFGMVFAEAQAMGLPVASFASGGIPEAVKHKETGLLAPEGDWRKLAENINLLLENRDLWDSFSEEGMRYVRENFDVKSQSKKLESIYDKVLNKKE